MTSRASWSATAREQHAYRAVRGSPNKIARFCARMQNGLIDLVRPKDAIAPSSPELSEILWRARKGSDISDYLPTLFRESLSIQPRLIVELGVRDGESTFVFERIAKLCGATCVSIDIEPSAVTTRNPRCHFVQSDDIEFAKEFPAWCVSHAVPTRIDILFVDTTHFFEHTVGEIECWFPLLAPCAKVFFHDTNQRRIYFRNDGSMGVGWSNSRCDGGVGKISRQKFQRERRFHRLGPGVVDHASRKMQWIDDSDARRVAAGESMIRASPALTVVLIAGNNRQRAQRMLRSVLEQDIADEILIMVTDLLLTRRLVANGEKLYRAANLTLKHWNDVKLTDGWIALFYSNQIYICDLLTAEKWSPIHRIVRLLATPLVPFVRLLKNYRQAKRNRVEMKQFFADLPASFLFHLASAAGIAAGLLFGYQQSKRKFADCETSAQCWD